MERFLETRLNVQVIKWKNNNLFLHFTDDMVTKKIGFPEIGHFYRWYDDPKNEF